MHSQHLRKQYRVQSGLTMHIHTPSFENFNMERVKLNTFSS